MNLVRAELGRFAARGFVRLMLAVLVVAFGVTIATTLVGSHRPTANEVAYARQRADEAWAQQQQAHAECLSSNAGTSPGASDIASRTCGPPPVRPKLTGFMTGVFVFEYQIHDLIYFLVAFMALFGFLVGASYIGAELTSGGMTNLLLWRPQRTVVLGTKLGTLVAAVSGVAVLGGAVYIGAFRLIAEVAGLPGLLNAAFWGDLSLLGLRGLALVGLATGLGFAIATLGRHTSAALGVIAAYGVVWELGGRLVMEIVQAGRPEQWMFSSYLMAWASGSAQFWDQRACLGVGGDCDPSYTITWLPALVVLLVVVGGFLAAAFVNFRRRDLA